MPRAPSPSERMPRAPLALAFLCVGANGLSSIAADTLFVSAFSLGQLAQFVGVSALVRVAASFLYAALSERILGSDPPPARAARLDAWVVAITAAGFALSAIASASSSLPVIYAVCLAQLVLPPLLPLVAFNTTAGALRARDAKRVLPFVAAAATVGSIAVGGAASVLANGAGLPSLFVLAAVMAAAAAPLLYRIGSARSEEEPPRSSLPSSAAKPATTLREVLHDLRAWPAVRVVVGFSFFGAVAMSFADYAFKAALKGAYDREGVARALGLFGMASNGVVLALQLAVTGPLVGKLGVGRTLAVFPSILAAASLAAFGLPAVIGTGAARLAEVVVRYGVGNSVADVLLVPLARAVRTRAKVLVKGAASPLGALLAGGVLALFGETGPSPLVRLVMVAAAALVLLISVQRAPAAYADALAKALARGRAAFDVTPEAALVFRSAVRHKLQEAIAARRFDEVKSTLDLMTDRVFGVDDTRPALAAPDVATRRAAISAAAKLAPADGGDALLALVPPDQDPALEHLVLSHARSRGALASDERIARAVARGDGEGASDAEIDLWAEGLLHDALAGRREGASAQARLDRALKQLRRAARDGQGHRRGAALDAIGQLGDKRAEREVMIAMASPDPQIFRAAASTAIRIDAAGAVQSLVARLVAGPHPAISTQALALAGPRAVRELIHALPVTRGDGAIAPTAVAEGRTVSGTVRAARALARIGQSASREVLPMFGELGHRARTSVARAFAARGMFAGPEERKWIEGAIVKLVGYGGSLLSHRDEAASTSTGKQKRGLLEWELEQRLEATVGAIFDLASTLGERSALQRARMLVQQGRAKDDALELLETILRPPLGSDAARFASAAIERRPPRPHAAEAAPDASGSTSLDGWLEKCRKYDARELPSADPMLGVLDKVLILREVPLFRGLSGEDLYPVAEIASVEELESPAVIVRQGEPSDDLYVVLEGELSVEKDGAVVGALGPSKTFGELGVLDGEPRAATVQSSGPCKLLRIPRSELEGLLEESPELAKGIIRTLLGYVRGKGDAAPPATVREVKEGA